MSRTKQALINYHTGGKTSMPSTGDVRFGEIVVRHNAEAPQLLIKVSSGTSGQEGYGEWFVPFIASGEISTAIAAAITQEAGVVNESITQLQNKISAVSATVTSDYALSANTHAEIETAKIDAEIASSGYTDEQIRALSGNVVSAIDGVTGGDLSNLKSKVQALEAFSGVVESNYATKEFVGAASGYAYNQAKSDVIGESTDTADADTVYGAKAYASGLVKTLSGDVVSYVDTEISEISESVGDAEGKITSLSGTVSALSADMKTYIDNELSTVYTYKGSVADLTALNAISNPEVGDVYNVVAANGEPGQAGYTPAGTNYAWVGESSENAGDAHWDALGGTVDLSNYATVSAATNLQNQIDTINSKIEGATGDVTGLSGVVESFSAYVETHYATSADTEAAIEKAKIEAEIASSAYTDSQIEMLSGVTSAYVANQLTTVNSDISDLKAFTANTAATHDEVATQSAATFNSAYTAAVASAESYTDTQISAAVNTLKGSVSESGATLGALEDRIDALDELIGGNTDDLEEAISSVSGRVESLESSAETWNNATQGAQFASVSSDDEHYDGGQGSGATVDSNAKLSYTEGGKITLDLSELIIDCGDFE